MAKFPIETVMDYAQKSHQLQSNTVSIQRNNLELISTFAAIKVQLLNSMTKFEVPSSEHMLFKKWPIKV